MADRSYCTFTVPRGFERRAAQVLEAEPDSPGFFVFEDSAGGGYHLAPLLVEAAIPFLHAWDGHYAYPAGIGAFHPQMTHAEAPCLFESAWPAVELGNDGTPDPHMMALAKAYLAVAKRVSEWIEENPEVDQ